MDELRARAYLDLLLDTDSRPATPDGPTAERRARFTDRNHLTVPLATLLELADRPGDIPGLGHVDPARP